VGRTSGVVNQPGIEKDASCESAQMSLLDETVRSSKHESNVGAVSRMGVEDLFRRGGVRAGSCRPTLRDVVHDETRLPTSLDRDRDLLTALLEREPTAAEALIDAYGDRAYRLALRITGNVQDAEEVVQDALCAVIWKIGDFRGESAFGSWIFRIVANAAYNKLRGRHNRRRDVSLDEVLPAFAEGGCQFMPMADWSTLVDDPAVQSQLRLALTAAIEDLPALYRVALVLHDVEDLSHTEIAEQLCLTLPAVKTRVHRARLFLRNRLGEAMKMLTGDV